MTTSATFRNPFDLPELRHRLSRFVSVSDALSCALVSKAWSYDFTSVVWFRINFRIQHSFANLPPDIINKYGHHIRVVNNTTTSEQVIALDNANVNKLRAFQVEIIASSMQKVHVYQIVARNNTSLQDLHLDVSSDFPGEPDSLSRRVSAQAFVPFSDNPRRRLLSNIHTLELTYLWLTHDDLLTILEASPGLSKLRLYYTRIIGSPTRSFQHPGISLLAWSLRSLFPPGQACPLLSYFPNLTTLLTWRDDFGYMVDTTRIKRDLERYCPRLTEYKLVGYTVSVAPEFLTDIATNVTRITILLEYLTPETIDAMLLHHKTLKKVAHFYQTDFEYEQDQVAEVSKDLLVTDEMIQQIPRKCSKLERLNLHRHEMDMDAVEAQEWVCKGLTRLRIRIKGLDTQEKIVKAISLWRAACWRRWQRQASGGKAATAVVGEDELPETDQSIEARVARHLFKFEHLRWVWLGYQTWTPI